MATAVLSTKSETLADCLRKLGDVPTSAFGFTPILAARHLKMWRPFRQRKRDCLNS